MGGRARRLGVSVRNGGAVEWDFAGVTSDFGRPEPGRIIRLPTSEEVGHPARFHQWKKHGKGGILLFRFAADYSCARRDRKKAECPVCPPYSLCSPCFIVENVPIIHVLYSPMG